MGRSGKWPLFLVAIPMLGLLAVPILALVLASSPTDLNAGMGHPLFGPALWLSIRTTLMSLGLVVLLGTPLAWWLATVPRRRSRFVEVLVDLPIVLPPAVIGIALLQAFGRKGLFGEQLDALGIQIPFTTAAVILAQVMVSAPFYIQSAAAAFRRVETDPYRGLFPSPPLFDRMPTYRTQGKRSLNFLSAESISASTMESPTVSSPLIRTARS